MLTIRALALPAIGLWLASIAAAFAQVPLPDDVSVTATAGNVPAEMAAFSGAWAGDGWDGSVPHALVVERIESDGTAQVLYAVGESPDRQNKPHWDRSTGKLGERALVVTRPNGDLVEYTVLPNGTLLGRYTSTLGGRSHVWLKRIPSVDPREIIAVAAAAPTPIWQDIRIPEQAEIGPAAGQTLMLQATLYRSGLPGRQPLVILNHGFGGRQSPAEIRETYRYEAEARVFLMLGDSVVVPMRKGRGASEGPMLESLNAPPGTDLESALEDVKAALAYMDEQPYVDPKRVVVAGVSRGGMLSVAYAGRDPASVAGVINISGGWWSDYYGGDTNARWFADAGRTFKTPTLWLYAEGDTRFSLDHVERYFEAFRSAGGTGRLIEVHGIPEDGHALFGWTEKWKDDVTDYLKGRGLVP